MNSARRGIRNTMLALYGVAFVYVGVNRLHAAVVDADTPRWLRATLSLGLDGYTTARRTPAPGEAADWVFRDFTRLDVSGDFILEIVGAAEYKVSFPAADGTARRLRARRKGEQLWLQGDATGDADAGLTVRIETPAVTQVVATGLRGLTLRGLQGQQLDVDLQDVGWTRLQRNAVAHWKVASSKPLDLHVDQATLAAGRVQIAGELVLHSDQ
jgi:hypothetical protein